MRRVGAFAAVLAALVVTNGAAGALVLADGLAGMARPGALAAATVLLGALWAAVVAILRAAGTAPADTGLWPTRATPGWVAAGAGGAVVAAAGLVGATVAAGASVTAGTPAVPVAATAAALVVNAAFQDVGLFGLGAAAGGGRGWLAAGALFVATHLAESTAPLYVLNVALFAALLVRLGRRGGGVDAALPIGVHAGWNAALVLAGALPGTAEVAAVRWSAPPSAWTGGAGGVEAGLAYTALVAAALAATAARRAAAAPA